MSSFDGKVSEARQTLAAFLTEHHVLVRRWAIVLGSVAAATWAIWYWYSLPTRLTVAVGPAGTEREAFIKRLAQTFSEAKKPVRLRLVPAKDSADAARLLDADKVNLAVVRSDEAKLADGRSVAIINRRAIVLVAKSSASFGVDALARQRIVIGATIPGVNRVLITRLLGHAGVGDTGLSEIPPGDIPAALGGGKADVAVLIVDPASASTRTLLAEIGKALAGSMAIGALPSPDALVAIHREVVAMTLPAGIFGGARALPEEKLATVAITEELVADSDFSETTAALLVKALAESRGRLSGSASAYEITLPPQDQPRRFMPHPGVALSSSDKNTSFLETYSDQIWLGLFALGLIGSSLVGLGSWLGLWSPASADPILMEMLALVAGLEKAGSVEEVDKAERRLREIAVAQLQNAGDGTEIGPSHPSSWFPVADAIARSRREELERAHCHTHTQA